MKLFLTLFPHHGQARSLLACLILASFCAFTGRQTISTATAETLPNLSAECFTYMPGHESLTNHVLTIKGFHAQLTGTRSSISVATTIVRDHASKMDAAALTRLNAAAAYAALIAYHHGMTDNCASQPLPETQEVQHTLPELHWQGLILQRGASISHASTAHMRLLSTEPNIHAQFDATGMSSPGTILLPPTISGDILFTPSPQPPYDVTVQKLHTSLNGSDIDGEGHVLAAAGAENIKGDVHFSITHIGRFIDQVGKAASPEVTGALVIARLMGNHEGNHRTGWHITMENSEVRINGIKLPIPF